MIDEIISSQASISTSQSIQSSQTTTSSKGKTQLIISDDEYQWVCHVVDHFTKFHIIWAQETKTMEETADNFERYVLAYLGLPKLFQSDNGIEFRNQCMRKLIRNWDGDCKVVYGRPRHPQSQGLVEQANGTLSRLICNEMHEQNTSDWASLLPKIMYNLNCNRSTGNFLFFIIFSHIFSPLSISHI